MIIHFPALSPLLYFTLSIRILLATPKNFIPYSSTFMLSKLSVPKFSDYWLPFVDGVTVNFDDTAPFDDTTFFDDTTLFENTATYMIVFLVICYFCYLIPMTSTYYRITFLFLNIFATNCSWVFRIFFIYFLKKDTVIMSNHFVYWILILKNLFICNPNWFIFLNCIIQSI